MNPATPKRLACYRRVSRVAGRDVESEAYQTEEIQFEACEAWGRARGVEIVADKRFVDRDVSGAAAERPGFEAAMAELRAGRVDGIIVATLDRLSRQSTIDALKRVQEIQDAGGIVASVGGEVPVDPTSDTGEFILTLFAAIARMEWRRYQARWLTAKTRAAERGAQIARAPLGYRHAPDGAGRLEPDPDAAPLMREAFAIAAKQGERKALAYLQANGLMEDRTGWHLRRMLARRAYLGEAAWNGRVVQGAHEPLTDLATWTRAQGNAAPGQRTPKATYPLSRGACRCASCGTPLVGTRAGGDRKYRCATGGGRGVKLPCDAPAWADAEQLEELTRALLVIEAEAREMDPEAHLEVLPEIPATPDLSDAESALRSAELARDEFAADTRARGVLGDEAWYRGLEARTKAVQEAERDYQDALAAAQPGTVTPRSEEIAAAALEELWECLERLGVVVSVRRGREPLAQRATLESAPESG